MKPIQLIPASVVVLCAATAAAADPVVPEYLYPGPEVSTLSAGPHPTRAEIRDELRRAARAGELKATNEADVPATTPLLSTRTRAEVRSEARQPRDSVTPFTSPYDFN